MASPTAEDSPEVTDCMMRIPGDYIYLDASAGGFIPLLMGWTTTVDPRPVMVTPMVMVTGTKTFGVVISLLLGFSTVETPDQAGGDCYDSIAFPVADLDADPINGLSVCTPQKLIPLPPTATMMESIRTAPVQSAMTRSLMPMVTVMNATFQSPDMGPIASIKTMQ